MANKKKKRHIENPKARLFINRYPREIKTNAEWCKTLKIHSSTYYAWLKDPEIIKAIDEKIQKVFEEADRVLSVAYKYATAKLINLLNSKNEWVVLKASTTILGLIKNVQIDINDRGGNVTNIYGDVNLNQIKKEIQQGNIDIEQINKEIKSIEAEVVSIEAPKTDTVKETENK